MRGLETKQASMLMLVSPESRVPAAHPLRQVKKLTDAALQELSSTFDAMYSIVGRPSIPPERLLRSTLLMAFYSIRSERQFCEQLDYNLLFRWFLDMDMDRRSARRLITLSRSSADDPADTPPAPVDALFSRACRDLKPIETNHGQ